MALAEVHFGQKNCRWEGYALLYKILGGLMILISLSE